MKFRIFGLFVFVATHVNISFDTVQHRRFTNERKEFRVRSKTRKCLNKFRIYKNDSESDETSSKQEKVSESTQPSPSLINRLWWLIEYNENGFMHMIILYVHLFLLIYLVITTTLYSSFPVDRDTSTMQYKNRVLRTLESFYVLDFLYRYERSRIFNRLLAMLLFEYLILRLRSAYQRYQAGTMNRHRYKRISIVQINMAYASILQTDICGLLRLIRHSACHQCDMKSSEALRQAELMSQLSKRLKNFDKIDRIYFFNQIEFDRCYIDHPLIDKDFFITEDQDNGAHKLETLKETELNSTFLDTCSSIIERSIKNMKTCLLFLIRIEKPSKRPYVSKPMHRVDPPQLLALILIYFVSTFALVVLVNGSLWALTYPMLEQYGLDWNNFSETLLISLRKLILDYNNFLRLLVGYITFILLALNGQDNGLMAYSSLLCLSRSKKVVKLLEKEIDFHHVHLRKFCLFIDMNNIDLDNIPQVDEEVQGDLMEDSHAKSVERGSLMMLRRGIVPSEQDNSINDRYIALNLKDEENEVSLVSKRRQISYILEEKSSDSSYDKIINAYKCQISKASLVAFNENVDILIDLIGVLQNELDDLKEFFTFYLNLILIVGTAGSSMALTLFLESSDWSESFISFAAITCTVVPLVYALFMGATSERAFRGVYRTLMRLMINEIGLVDLQVIRRMQKVCKHLDRLENRSFMIIGNFSLTFGSMTSILGWIATGNLLLQRFLT